MISLEKISNIAVILAAFCVGGIAIYNRVAASSLPSPQPDLRSRFLGKRLPLKDLNKGTPAVIIFASRTCDFCSESFPFYKSLADIRNSAPGAISLILAYPAATQTEEDTRTYFNLGGVVLNGAEPAVFPALGIRGTPTLALVDGEGRLREVWEGKLSPARKIEALS